MKRHIDRIIELSLRPLAQTEGQGCVERFDGDVAETALRQDTHDPVAVAEGKRSRRLGIGRRQGRQQIARGFEWQPRRLVFARRAPGNCGQAALVMQGRAQPRKGGGRIGKEHDAEFRRQQVEAFPPEIVMAGVGQDQLDAEVLGGGTRLSQQGFRHIDAGNAAGPGETGKRRGRVATATSDIENLFTGLNGGSGDEPVAKRRQHGCEPLLVRAPADAAIVVPVGNLRGIVLGHASN